ncbi:MAG: VCBS domain-containing protein, partial [Acidobacteria bacterium]|nr:VCBS domain-containing protein [Acidobacteriota bacterium]
MTFSFMVHDGTAYSAAAYILTTTHSAVDDAPAFSAATATANAAENQAAVGTYTATDTESDSIAYTISGTDSDLFSIVSSTGVLTFSSAPNFEAPGCGSGDDSNTCTVTVTATANSLTDTLAVTVTVTDANDAPAFTNSGTTTGTEDAVYSFTPTTSDADSDSVTVTCSTCPSWLAMSGSTLTGTPSDSGVGANSVVLTANDGTVDTTQSFTVTVTNVNDVGSVAISGTVAEDSTLTATVTDDDNDGTDDTYTYSWESSSDLSSWSSIGSNSNQYALTQSEVGKYIRASVSYTDDDGTVESHSSQTTGTASNVDDDNTAVPTISGTLTQGQTLTASPVPLSGNDEDGTTDADANSYAGYSYQWQSCTTTTTSTCGDISGATSSTYALTNSEVSKYMRVTVSYTDDLSTAESVNSALTTAISNINDAATISGANTGSITEDASPNTVSGTPTVSDDDTGEDTLQDVSSTAAGSGYGTYAVSSGIWTYTLDNSDSTVNALDSGSTAITDTFDVTSSDGGTTMTVTVTISGANDAPTSAAATVAGTEDTLKTYAASNFAFSDVDSGDSISRIQITTLESTGTLECNNKNGLTAGWEDCVADDYVAAGTDLRLTPATDSVA